MADPLGATSAILSLASGYQRALRSLRELNLLDVSTSEHDGFDVEIEAKIYIQILEEVGQIVLTDLPSLPESARLGLQLCDKQLQAMHRRIETISDGRKRRKLDVSFTWRALSEPLGGFRRSVTILRDIVMDTLLHEQIKQHRVDYSTHINVTDGYQKEEIMRLVAELAQQQDRSSAADTPDSSDRRTDQGGNIPRDVIEKLQQAVRGLPTGRPSNAEAAQPEPFEFLAKVMHSCPGSDEALTSVCAKLDTGSSEDWISSELVSRLGLDDQIVPLGDDGPIYVGFGGVPFQPAGSVELAWTYNSIKSWRTTFLVNSEAPFDMVLGKRFIVREGVLVFGEPVLANSKTRLAPLTQDDYQEMEAHMKERKAQNLELSLTRQARDAGERQKRREAKAASRMSFAATPGLIRAAPARAITVSSPSSTRRESISGESSLRK